MKNKMRMNLTKRLRTTHTIKEDKNKKNPQKMMKPINHLAIILTVTDTQMRLTVGHTTQQTGNKQGL